MATKRKPKAPKQRTSAQTHAGEALISSAELYRATGYPHPAISAYMAQGVIKPAKRGFWPTVETLGAIVRKLKERTDDNGAKDRARRNSAEADEAEMRALEAMGKLCPMSDAKLFWSDARIEVKQTIERASYLTPVQKTKLLTELAALKPKLETDK